MNDFEIIGISGQAGSGKDLIADWFVNEKNYVKVAFADPMKRFASALFGYSNEQLWGPSELRNKKEPATKEFWDLATTRFQAIAGRFIILVVPQGERVKAHIKLLEWFHSLIDTYSELSPREVLQTLGTEWGRTVYPTMWTEFTHQSVIPSIRKGRYYSNHTGIYSFGQIGDEHTRIIEHHYNGVVIPDHRFINEIESTREKDGYVLRVRRLAQEDKQVGIVGHKSESEQKSVSDSVFDLIIETEEGIDRVYNTLEEIYSGKIWRLKRERNLNTNGIPLLKSAT